MLNKMIDKVVKEGSTAAMESLKGIFEEAMEHLCECEPPLYWDAMMRIHKLVNPHSIGEDIAKCWVSRMENRDGTHGEHWTIDQIRQVMRERAIKEEEWNFYTAMNMVYSDFYNPKFDTLTYVELAKDWLNDEDISGNKLLKYYYFVVENP